MDREYLIVGAEGEIEIPKKIREALGIVDGTILSIRRDGGLLIVTPVTPTEKATSIEE